MSQTAHQCCAAAAAAGCAKGLSPNSKAMFDNLLELMLKMEDIACNQSLRGLYPEVRAYILDPASSTFTVVKTR